jgi:hypothetical protein
MEHERKDGFEEELREALTPRPAPPTLLGRILAERTRRAAAEQNGRRVMWMRLAAGLAIAAALAGAAGWQWQRVEERRRGEAARQQVMTALGVTARALDKVQRRLESGDERNDGKEE